MNIQKFLDAKHGKVIGRVYILVLLFIFNALIPIGAVMRYLHAMSPIVLIIGAIGTAICMLVLSTPTKLD